MQVDNLKNVVVTKFWVDLTRKSPCENHRLPMNIFIRLLRCSMLGVDLAVYLNH